MTRFVKVPEDVKLYAKKKRCIRYAFRIAIFLFLMTVFILTLTVNPEKTFENVKTKYRIIATVVMLLIPFIASGVPFCFRDRSYVGVVKKVKVDTVYKSDWALKNVRQGRDYNRVWLTVDIPTSKRHIKRMVSSAEAKYLRHLEVYHEDDVLCYIDGTNYAFRYPENDDERRICVVCGLTAREISDRCEICGHTYIKGTASEMKKTLHDFEYKNN